MHATGGLLHAQAALTTNMSTGRPQKPDHPRRCQIPPPCSVDQKRKGVIACRDRRSDPATGAPVTFRHQGRRLFFYSATQAEARAHADAAHDRLGRDGPATARGPWLTGWADG